ncbi:MAG TPA: lactate racemase domain-containing protein [bacterium]|nr:lactate racemase domain-containing protein [bacterium]
MIGDRIEVNLAGGLDVPLPRMVPVKVNFETTRIEDVAGAVQEQMRQAAIRDKVQSGMTIAVGCGSRGVANIATVAQAVIGELKALGAKPFIFPAMGSHGAATAEGQRAVLEGYGITESHVGCPIRATMETEELGRLDDGTPIYMDRYAAEADGVVLINRIKPHTNFRAPIESGIVKMMTIGMGKIKGATTLHAHGMDAFGEVLPKVARFIMARKPFLFGMGLVENAKDETAIIEAIPAEAIFEREPDLQAKSKAMMGRLLFNDIDVLVIDEMGKNISGAGFDPNVTGRPNRDMPTWDGINVKRLVVLDLTEETHGNATGLGLADVITMKIWKQLDIAPTYANVITSCYLDGGAIPIIMNTEEDAIKLAVKTAIRVKPAEARIVRIKNTLELSEILVSEPMLDEVRRHPNMESAGQPTAFRFDAQGNLAAA